VSSLPLQKDKPKGRLRFRIVADHSRVCEHFSSLMEVSPSRDSRGYVLRRYFVVEISGMLVPTRSTAQSLVRWP